MAIDNKATGVHHRAAPERFAAYGDTDNTGNPAGAPLLSVLATENILSILACCDICSVVTIAQVNIDIYWKQCIDSRYFSRPVGICMLLPSPEVCGSYSSKICSADPLWTRT